MWFEQLFGFREVHPDQVRQSLSVHGEWLNSTANASSFRCGTLEMPSLADLRQQSQLVDHSSRLEVTEVVADVQELHQDPRFHGAMFQVASQSNLLEMPGPSVTPDVGIDSHELDHTQGPASAIACGAGTAFRNYFVELKNGHIGQTSDVQVDCLYDMGRVLGNQSNGLWCMRNGYALATERGLAGVERKLARLSGTERDELRSHLRIGVQWNTQVTLAESNNVVSQAYCSALPVSYSPHSPSLWEPFARLILEASYEATLCAAMINADRTGNSNLLLTLLGGGAFGNDTTWIMDAVHRALLLASSSNLRVGIVSYGSSNPEVKRLLSRI